MLAYLSILVLVPIFAAKESRFARFHANQGLILLLISAGYEIITELIGSILMAIFSIAVVVTWIFNLISLVFAVLAVIGIINAANGRAKELPVIGKFQILK